MMVHSKAKRWQESSFPEKLHRGQEFTKEHWWSSLSAMNDDFEERIYRSSYLKVFSEIGFLRNFAKFKGKHLGWSFKMEA